jgi:hypothetical protein
MHGSCSRDNQCPVLATLHGTSLDAPASSFMHNEYELWACILAMRIILVCYLLTVGLRYFVWGSNMMIQSASV